MSGSWTTKLNWTFSRVRLKTECLFAVPNELIPNKIKPNQAGFRWFYFLSTVHLPRFKNTFFFYFSRFTQITFTFFNYHSSTNAFYIIRDKLLLLFFVISFFLVFALTIREIPMTDRHDKQFWFMTFYDFSLRSPAWAEKTHSPSTNPIAAFYEW